MFRENTMPSPSPVQPATWAEVLDRVQQALERTAAEAAARAAAAEALPTDAPEGAWRRALEAFAERLQRLHAAAEYAGEAATAAEAALAAAEADLQRWQTAAAACAAGCNPRGGSYHSH
jgi:hypothetical protein